MKKLFLLMCLFSGYSYGQTIRKVKNSNTSSDNVILHDPPIAINSYSEVIALDERKSQVVVADSNFFITGDTVLPIQMKGAIIDTSNTASFGTIINCSNAGNYEMNYINAKSGNIITLKNKLTRKYDVPHVVVQLMRVPYIKITNYNGELYLYAMEWNQRRCIGFKCSIQLHYEFVTDEYQAEDGMVSIDNILDALIGDTAEYSQDEYGIVKRDENSWMADG